jgi:predicted deacylase
MARCQAAQILVHNAGDDGTLRGAAVQHGISAITVEVGNPQRFQPGMINLGTKGIHNVMVRLGMIDGQEVPAVAPPVVCSRSYWIYTDKGGVLEVQPELAARVEAGDRVARVSNVYGTPIAEYFAPEAGVVVGKSSNPVNQTGSRILHLGVPGEPPPRERTP